MLLQQHDTTVDIMALCEHRIVTKITWTTYAKAIVLPSPSTFLYQQILRHPLGTGRTPTYASLGKGLETEQKTQHKRPGSFDKRSPNATLFSLMQS